MAGPPPDRLTPAPRGREEELVDIHVALTCEAVRRRYGYDFGEYVPASIRRGVQRCMGMAGLPTFGAFLDRLLGDEVFFREMLGTLAIGTTEMFRDPTVYMALRETVLPVLDTYPRINLWIAGCSTGEEAYSMAILLTEAGLYERAWIHATDFDPGALARARDGVYGAEAMKRYTRAYQEMGGRVSFSHYYTAAYGLAVMNPALRHHMVFSEHNLATDASFAEMHLVMCRNVMIYFGEPLRQRVFDLFRRSLVRRGFLCLGTKESLHALDSAGDFETISAPARIYQARDQVRDLPP